MAVKVTDHGLGFSEMFAPRYASYSSLGGLLYQILLAEQENADVLFRAFTEGVQSEFVGADEFRVYELARPLIGADLLPTSTTPHFIVQLPNGSFDESGYYKFGEIEGDIPEPIGDYFDFKKGSGASINNGYAPYEWKTAGDFQTEIAFALRPDASCSVEILPGNKSFKLTFSNPAFDVANILVNSVKNCPRIGGEVPGVLETWTGPKTKRSSYLLNRYDDDSTKIGPLQIEDGEPVPMTITELGEALTILNRLTWNESADLVLSQSLNLFAVFSPNFIGEGKQLNIKATPAATVDASGSETQFME